MQFDAPFFAMTANEANGTDPQQRLMLEVAYETLENGTSSPSRTKLCRCFAYRARSAGVPMHTVIGSQTSVYVGCFTKDFESVAGRDPCECLAYP